MTGRSHGQSQQLYQTEGYLQKYFYPVGGGMNSSTYETD